MNKRITSLFLITAMIFMLSACNNNGKSNDEVINIIKTAGVISDKDGTASPVNSANALNTDNSNSYSISAGTAVSTAEQKTTETGASETQTS